MDKLICVGKNYLDHARELGDAVPEMPVLFLKPPSVLLSVARSGERIEVGYDFDRGQIHHECEIVIRLDRDGYRMSMEDARASIGEVTLGLDMTLRDVQAQLKKNGHPWEIGKVFPGSAIIGPWMPGRDFSELTELPFEFSIDGQVRQQGRASQMRLSPAECIEYASRFFPLKKGDLVFTGTPAGVGPIAPGQKARLSWGDRLSFAFAFARG